MNLWQKEKDPGRTASIAALAEKMVMIAYAKASAGLTTEALRAHTKDRLAAYKIPMYIELVGQSLPQNASGKLFKRQVREEFLAERDTGVVS